MAVKLIIGLGNPGSKYLWTRHNAGFMVLDRFADRVGIAVTRKAFSGLCGEGIWSGSKLLLLKPQTFMNLSGRSVAPALNFHKASTSDIIVIHDDLDVPFGKVKLKSGGGHGGHNGLRSMVAELGTADFMRIRVGIGRPLHGDVVDYVLNNWNQEEMRLLPKILDATADAVELLLSEGLPKAMSIYNNRDLIA